MVEAPIEAGAIIYAIFYSDRSNSAMVSTESTWHDLSHCENRAIVLNRSFAGDGIIACIAKETAICVYTK